ncbi:EVE domain-containing protein [Taibaiella chishuiensis]|uniref:UPF0310 protein B0I18_114118 n=1 Tax=Taibaiella chishuiensis TaxID=1434707 RepID=A0A2P8CVD2_9BACT|nr:EVE domain-containing protein [Taibaiella chishuiensis]PSK88906.1 EVE domain-containing protein [Taibaiella chishuiensis]
MKRDTKYWIIVASKDHVAAGISGGFAQACHGKAAPLKRMQEGDFIIYYSGKQTMGKPALCQEFTAIGRVRDEDTFQVSLSADFCPSRRNIGFLPARTVSILPLIPELDFIPDKKYWGYPFRFGFFEIGERDFNLISSKMLQQEYAEEN